jgi:alpha-1,6-mannosyltransferase
MAEEARAHALQFSWESSMEALFGRLYPSAFAHRAELCRETPPAAALAA